MIAMLVFELLRYSGNLILQMMAFLVAFQHSIYRKRENTHLRPQLRMGKLYSGVVTVKEFKE